MGRVIAKSDYRLEVRLRHPGDYGIMFWSGATRSDDDTLRELREVEQQILRHVDGIRRGGVHMAYDEEPVCEFCGAKWTEGDSPHNGGCCDKDCEVFNACEQANGA